MKAFLKWLGIGVIGAISFGALAANATLEVAAPLHVLAKTDFNAPLATYGKWIEVKSYGRCWHPSNVPVDWRPYCNGYWVWTECGWYWHSDEPWGWACYHYGSWIVDPKVGWVWVPDIKWAPAWVSWRYGGGYVGWAPLPPPRFLFFSQVAAPSQFVFVPAAHLTDPIRRASVILNNAVILNKAAKTFKVGLDVRVIDGVKREVLVNEGPGIEVIQKAAGKTFAIVPIHEAAERAQVPTALSRKSSPAQPGIPGQHPSGLARETAGKKQPAGALPAQGQSIVPPVQPEPARSNLTAQEVR
ncbi:MAG: DUF6600 domain-containing protein [Limisphaerales bacterium]